MGKESMSKYLPYLSSPLVLSSVIRLCMCLSQFIFTVEDLMTGTRDTDRDHHQTGFFVVVFKSPAKGFRGRMRGSKELPNGTTSKPPGS